MPTYKPQRNAVQFVAAENGFWDDGNHVLFARQVGNEALGAAWILKLREYVLRRGDFDGRFQASDEVIGLSIKWPRQRPVRILINAFKSCGVLTKVKGKGDWWQYVDWWHTPTGQYQRKRKEEAYRKWLKRNGEEGEGEPVIKGNDAPSVRGHSTDSPRTIHGQYGSKKERKESADTAGPETAPPAPLAGGGLGFREWFDNYPKTLDELGCRALWDKLSPGELEKVAADFALYRCARGARKPVSSVTYLKRKHFDFLKPKDLARFRSGEKSPNEQAAESQKVDPLAYEINGVKVSRKMEIKRALKGQCKGLSLAELEDRAEEQLQREIESGELKLPKTLDDITKRTY